MTRRTIESGEPIYSNKALAGPNHALSIKSPMQSYLQRFDADFAPKLNKRAKTFRLMFELLEANCRDFIKIVETGCVREEGCWDGDGCSTVLFNDYVKARGKFSSVTSVDINADHLKLAKQLVNPKGEWFHQFVLQDSVAWLGQRPGCGSIDLLYLDSFDFDPQNPHPSSLHHLKELAAAQKCLIPGSIIAVDDNHADGTGKGRYVHDYLNDLGIPILADDYQKVWIWK